MLSNSITCSKREALEITTFSSPHSSTKQLPAMAKKQEVPSLTPRDLTLPGRSLPPAMPLIISTQDRWDPHSCKLETHQHNSQPQHLQLVTDTLQLLGTINKPVAVLSICGPYRSGKSYFISRLLGRPGAFQLGHRMQACTRGIWMATTVLECEQFVTILLDTEGIDAIRASETMDASLLTVTTLLSSYLIYNSMKVPQKVDLDKMRCFTQLSRSLLVQKGESMRAEVMRKFFPHFLWLLRDVTLKVTDRAGQTISATEFLHTRVLASQSGQPTELGKSLCSLFPSLECHTLPMPSINPKVIKNIVEQQDKLKPAFNKAVDELIQRILQQVTPKKAINGVSVVDGPALAALTRGYVDAINTPGAIPDLEQGWQAVIKWKLKELSDKLVEEYRREMEKCLGDNLPMEERNLMRIHKQTLSRKRDSLQQEIHRLKPLSSTSGDKNPILIMSQLEQTISQTNEGGEVIGGVLFQFTTQNYYKSKQQCEEVLMEAVKSSGIHKKCQEAFINSQPLDIMAEIWDIHTQYCKQAVGPAANEVLEKGHRELNQLGDSLKRIPGPPSEVEVIGEGSDRVKLSWQPPEKNPEAAESYVVWKQEKGKQWERVRETKKTKILITGLKSGTVYQFRVTATNDLIKSVATTQCSLTKESKAMMGAIGGGAGALAFALSPVLGYVAMTEGGMSTRKIVAISVATAPISLICAPVTATVGGVWAAREMIKDERDWGDLSPGSDDETSCDSTE